VEVVVGVLGVAVDVATNDEACEEPRANGSMGVVSLVIGTAVATVVVSVGAVLATLLVSCVCAALPTWNFVA
jgi:hypothetical protein